MTDPASTLAPPAPVAAGRWRCRGRDFALTRPWVIGILNVTPDSFSDGGRFTAHDRALEHARAMLADGADALDVGGESTRPGAAPVEGAAEAARVVPIVAALRAEFPGVPLSVDTVKASVARAALDAGAEIVNDVSAGRLDPAMAETCAAAGAGVILMHSRGTVADMATFVHAEYWPDPVADVVAELAGAIGRFSSAGVGSGQIVLDPGIGFSKRSAASLALLAGLPRLAALGYPVLVGASRKRFIGELTGVQLPADRMHGTTGANVAALLRGARLFRVHDVAAARQALDVAWAILQAEPST